MTFAVSVMASSVRPWNAWSKHDDRLAAGGVAGDLHGVLDGLGAGVGEERLLREIAGRERVQPLGELDRRLVPGDRLQVWV